MRVFPWPRLTRYASAAPSSGLEKYFRRACSIVLTWAYRASVDSMWVVACPSAASMSTAGLFFRVEKISIPSRVVRIMAARMRDHRRNAVVRLKPYAFANLFGIKTERAVLVMRGMKIAAGKEWSHLEFEIGIIRRDEFPRHKDGRFAFWDEQLVLDDEIVDLVTPARPRLVFERFNT